MQTFWTLLKESIITQSFLVALVWGAIVYMVVTGQVIPVILETAAYVTLGFFFGAKSRPVPTLYSNEMTRRVSDDQ